MTHDISRRTALQGAGIGAFTLFAGSAVPVAAHAQSSLRAVYHMAPPSGWLCDPQRPVTTNGAYQLYYLHSGQNNGPGGWDHASTSDGVAFTHHGVAIPLQPDFPLWSGSAVVEGDAGISFYADGARLTSPALRSASSAAPFSCCKRNGTDPPLLISERASPLACPDVHRGCEAVPP